MRKYGMTVVTMVSVATVVLLVTGWGSAVAAQVTSVLVTNDASHPVPVTQQGTANVNVTNTGGSAIPVTQQIGTQFLGAITLSGAPGSDFVDLANLDKLHRQ
jgi:hypothetical protein